MRRRSRAPVDLLLALILLSAPGPVPASSFVAFESGPVRPLALSPDGVRLFATNTPDNRLEILDVVSDGLRLQASVPVGLEPVAVAVRNEAEVWVVNHLSDGISVVDVAAPPPRVVRTLLVGDEPRDIVFAGPARDRAFITTARRGQNRPGDPELTTPGIGRADVWVFDATDLGAALGGTPITILTLFTDTPRALAVSPDGATVFAAGFHTGNRTTAIHEGLVCDGGAEASPCNVSGHVMPGGLPAPNTNVDLVPQPEVGLIVKSDGKRWVDSMGRDWSRAVRFSLPDEDVFALDASSDPPTGRPYASGVGTILFGMIVNPATGTLYVANTEGRNEVRFEGPGTFGGSTVRGHLHEARITVVRRNGRAAPRHLNKHIDYAVATSPPGVKERSLATPSALMIERDRAGECELTVKGVLGGEARGWLYDDVIGAFHSDRAGEPPLDELVLRAQAAEAGQQRTYTCVPPGSGARIGLDRDDDGSRDRDEVDAGSDPADPATRPAAPASPHLRAGQSAHVRAPTIR